MEKILFRFFRTGARIFFALTILLAPFRLRWVIWSRPFFPVYSDYTDFLFFASDIALLFMIAFWMASLLMEPRRIRAGNPFVWFMLVGLTLAGWISVLGSVDAILTRYHAVRFVILLLFYLYVVNEIISPAWVLVSVAAQGLIQVPVALGQSLAQSSLGLQTLGEHVLDPLRLGTSIVPVNGLRILRAYGLADHPNILGGCLAFAIVLMIAVVLYGKDRQRLYASLAVMMIFPALLLTYSRSAWLGLFVAVSFMVGFEAVARRWDSVRRVALLGAASLILSLPFLMSNIDVFEKRINSGNIAGDGPMSERAYLMQVSNTLFMEHSAIGVGLGASPLALKNRFENFPVNYQPPHYVPLTASLETGVIGGAFYLLLYLAPFVTFLLRWRTYIHNPVAMGTFALMAAISVVNLFDYYTWLYAPGRLWQWFAWGLYSAALEKVG